MAPIPASSVPARTDTFLAPHHLPLHLLRWKPSSPPISTDMATVDIRLHTIQGTRRLSSLLTDAVRLTPPPAPAPTLPSWTVPRSAQDLVHKHCLLGFRFPISRLISLSPNINTRKHKPFPLSTHLCSSRPANGHGCSVPTDDSMPWAMPDHVSAKPTAKRHGTHRLMYAGRAANQHHR